MATPPVPAKRSELSDNQVTWISAEQALARGFKYLEAGDHIAAADTLRQAVQMSPGLAQAWLGLGLIWLNHADPADAAIAFQQALIARPGYASARVGLGTALRMTGDIEGALAILREQLADTPDHFDGLVSYALGLRLAGRWAEALDHFQHAAALAPDNPKPRFEAAILHLLLGDFAAGWPAYEVRFAANGLNRPRIPGVPQWQGEPLAGKTILVLPEQGLGDTMQFVRYARLLKVRGARTLLACSAALRPLLARMPALDFVTSDGMGMPPADYQSPLLSLPLHFGTTLETVPAEVPYLDADPARVAAWAARMPTTQKRIGLVWAGGGYPDIPRADEIDRQRSLTLAAFAPFTAIPGARFYSLQVGPPAAQVAESGLPIQDDTKDIQDFGDTAAIVANLDLVITVDTSVAHLAGAMARPVWLLSRYDGCWRWLTARADNPWYPTMRVFRQPRAGDWDSVIAEVAEELAAFLK